MRPAAIAVLLAGAFAASTALAGDRRFMPVPAPATQRVDVVGTTPVVSANAKAFGGGASVLPLSGRKARVLVSLRNLGTAPLPVDAVPVVVTAGAEVLGLEPVDEAGAPRQQDSLATRNCMSVSKEMYSSCMASPAHATPPPPPEARRRGGAAATAAPARPAAEPLAPGQTRASQYVLTLPRRGPATLQVQLRAGGEALAFEFKEVD